MLRSTLASLLFATAMTILGAACAGGAPHDAAPPLAAPSSTPTTDAPDTDSPASQAPARDDDVFACRADADCVIVEMGCCDHCNGGFLLSVNKDRVDAARRAHQQSDCSGACTERGCLLDPKPVCSNQQCSRTERRIDAASGLEKRVEVANRVR